MNQIFEIKTLKIEWCMLGNLITPANQLNDHIYVANKHYKIDRRYFRSAHHVGIGGVRLSMTISDPDAISHLPEIYNEISRTRDMTLAGLGEESNTHETMTVVRNIQGVFIFMRLQGNFLREPPKRNFAGQIVGDKLGSVEGWFWDPEFASGKYSNLEMALDPDRHLSLPAQIVANSQTFVCEMDQAWQKVYTMDDWYDGPRGGVADYDGAPHYYRSVFLDTPTWNPDEDRFELIPLPTAAFEAALELQAIWEKWHWAHKSGTVSKDPDDERVLPEDKTKNAELTQILAAGRESGKDRMILVRGEFKLGCKHVRWRSVEQMLTDQPS